MPTTITVMGTDLFTVAAQKLGDATQANRIAAANSLTDFVVVGLTTLTIPDPDSTQSGGVAQQ